MSNLEIIAVMVSLLGVALTVQRHLWCWYVNMLAVVLYAVIFYQYKLYGETVLQILFFGMQGYGLWQWKMGQQQDHTIVVKRLPRQQAIQHLMVGAVTGYAFGLFLHSFTDAAVPWLDAQLTAFSLVASLWAARRYIESWWMWVVLDIVYVGLFYDRGLNLTAFLYFIFIMMAIFGAWKWQGIWAKNKMV